MGTEDHLEPTLGDCNVDKSSPAPVSGHICTSTPTQLGQTLALKAQTQGQCAQLPQGPESSPLLTDGDGAPGGSLYTA